MRSIQSMEVRDEAQVGTVRRLSDEFEAYSTMQGTGRLASLSRHTMHGTAFLLRKWVAAARLSDQTHAANARRIGVWSRPHPHEDKKRRRLFHQPSRGADTRGGR